MKANFSPISIFLLTICFTSLVFSQDKKEEQRIISTVASKIPLKVEFINNGMKTRLEDIRIKVTNIGEKAIYYAGFGVASAEEFAPRERVGFSSFQIGNGRLSDFSKSFDSLEAERAATTPFEPGDSVVFRIKKKEAELSWRLMKELGYPDDSKLVFEVSLLRFSDGSGYMGIRNSAEMPDPKDTTSR